ncbi:Heat shock transcription factor [Quillaja saponaria]|uniref:Heat shock transcription factor n=1 Tax=Quillaja saponaria TaxID=32244 RepID=A0AAD7LD28_QUISA|nr:Heat shock transcription factor [Quillaja saponaria]
MVVCDGSCVGSGDDGGRFCSTISPVIRKPINKGINEAEEPENMKAMGAEAGFKAEQMTVFDENTGSDSGVSNDGEGNDHGGFGSSSSPSSSSIGLLKPSEVERLETETSERRKMEVVEAVPVSVKEEEETVIDGIDGVDNCFSGVNGSSSGLSVELPKPMEGLYEVGPPPFLKKTFEMVEDPETDRIVSWSEARDSFIVWDSHELSRNLLPKYFKHSNFSSFIRQLNTYGFKKVDADRWEFANEGFQGGRKHLLKNIKRRNKYSRLQQGAITFFNSAKPGLEGDLERLKKDQNMLKGEILKLRQQHEDSQAQLTNVEDCIRSTECKQRQMLFFLTRIAKSPMLLQQLIQKIKRKRELDGCETGKRRRLLATHFPGSVGMAIDTTPSVVCRQQVHEFATLQSEITGFLPEAIDTSQILTHSLSPMNDELCSPIPSLRDNICGTTASNVSSDYHVMSEKLMGNNSAVNEELGANDTNFYLELENLISKPGDWDGCASGLVGQTGCIASVP